MTMAPIILTVDVQTTRPGAHLIAPLGLSTPHAAPLSVHVSGATQHIVSDPGAAQHALWLTPDADRLHLRWAFAPKGAPYPEALFAPRDSRYTRFADALAQEIRAMTPAGIKGIADHVASRFTYDHADTRFYDGHDEIPQLCGLTRGSCIDINAYFIACCRAAGFEAGYVTGYFIPEEKRSHCSDMHCWVVTRQNGVVQEWDIAHHLKMNTTDIRPGLNPKPGVRVPMAHSMGLSFPACDIADFKLLAEPMWRLGDGSWTRADLDIRLSGYDALV